jgi:hypothetical protein
LDSRQGSNGGNTTAPSRTPGDVDVLDVVEDFLNFPMGLEKLASRILSASGGSHVVNYCYHIMLEVRHWE